MPGTLSEKSKLVGSEEGGGVDISPLKCFFRFGVSFVGVCARLLGTFAAVIFAELRKSSTIIEARLVVVNLT
jgi:hypothetical protein